MPMQKLKLRQQPEAKIQKEIVDMLRIRGWLVRVMNASENMKGWPDLWASHFKYGQRFIEVKLPNMKGSSFTPAQVEWYPQMVAHGTPIWVLTGATIQEYEKLFRPQNFTQTYTHYLLKRM